MGNELLDSRSSLAPALPAEWLVLARRGWVGENRELFEHPAGSIPVVLDVQTIEILACPREITLPCWSLSLLVRL